MEGMAIFTGNSNPVLAKKICEYLSLPLGAAEVKTFSDGEIQIEITENVRLKDVFVLQSTCSPVNDNLVELLLMIDAFKRSSARRITVVIPYFGYARQDKKVAPRVPISAKLVADMITLAGANRIITMDLHAGQIQGFFNIPVDNLEEKIPTLPTDRPIVFVCGTGARSGESYYMVQDVRPELKNVYYLEGTLTFKEDGSFEIKDPVSG